MDVPKRLKKNPLAQRLLDVSSGSDQGRIRIPDRLILGARSGVLSEHYSGPDYV